MLTVDWFNKIVFIPQSYLTLISGNLYDLDTNAFRLDLKDLEYSPEGIVEDDIHKHTTETILGGVTYARFVEIINGYTIDVEDLGTPIRISLSGSNNNVADAAIVKANITWQVNNSAGLVSPNDWVKLVNAANTPEGSFGELMTQLLTVARFLGLK